MIEAVDINCDMGEAFGRWRVGDTDDASLMSLISSANIAAGFHAGDPNLIDQTVRLAAEHGVGIGAHPGYNDLQGFGRRKIEGTPRNWSTTSSIRSAQCANLPAAMVPACSM